MTSVTPLDKPVNFHNSRMVVFGIAIFGLCTILIAIGMALESFSECFLRHGHVFFNILGGLQWGLGSISIAAIGIAFWRFALRSGFQQVRLETAGVHFRLGTRNKPLESFFAWDQISAIIHQQRPDNQYIFISDKGGRQVSYTAYDIFRYKKLARLIAARANLQLAEPVPIDRRLGKHFTPTS
jgi:hypothetical protein